MKISLRGALVFSLLIHGALLVVGRDAFEPPDAALSGHSNLNVVVRATPLKRAPEKVHRDLAKGVEHGPPAASLHGPPESIGSRAPPPSAASDYPSPAVRTTRTDDLRAGTPSPQPMRRNTVDRTELGASADRTVDARSSSGEAVQPANPEDVTSYRLRLASLAGRYKRYPPLARERGQEGMVEVRVRVGPGLLQPQVTLGRSSGVDMLDEAAVETVSRASQGVELPAGLRERMTDIPVPVYFRLD